MNKFIIPSTVSLAVLLLSGCAHKYSEAPIATNFKTTKQKKLQAAQHWEVIGNDLAESIIRKIGTNRSVYVNSIDNDLKFNNSVYSFIMSRLISSGVKVSQTKTQSDIVINISTNDVKFSNKNRGRYTRTKGSMTMLGAGVGAIYGVSHLTSTPTVIATGAAVIGMDIYNEYNSQYASGATPKNEIIVTVSAVDGNKYVAHYSNIYYIDDSDLKLYEDRTRTIKLVKE